MQETEASSTKPYPSVSADSKINQAVIQYLDAWYKEHPDPIVDIEKIKRESALFQKALEKLDYEECAKIEGEQLTKELKLKYIRLAMRQGYLDV